MKMNILDPMHPERICWGCERYCPARDLVCGNGAIRTPHPSELFGRDWRQWAEEHERKRNESSHERTRDVAPGR